MLIRDYLAAINTLCVTCGKTNSTETPFIY